MTSLPPPPPPRDPGFRLANWRGLVSRGFEELVGIEIQLPLDLQCILCLRGDCAQVWRVDWEPTDDGRLPLRGPGHRPWWQCPNGCNQAVARQWPAEVAEVEPTPPWPRPPGLVRAATARRTEGQDVTAAPARLPLPPGERVRQHGYDGQTVLESLSTLIREDAPHRQVDVDAYIRGYPAGMGNRKSVDRALKRAAQSDRTTDWTWAGVLRRAYESVIQE
jgi:hypothetical protein